MTIKTSPVSIVPILFNKKLNINFFPLFLRVTLLTAGQPASVVKFFYSLLVTAGRKSINKNPAVSKNAATVPTLK
jgi:hypothetical protein